MTTMTTINKDIAGVSATVKWKRGRVFMRTATINGIEYEITTAMRSGVKWWYLRATVGGEFVNVAMDIRLRAVQKAAIEHASNLTTITKGGDE